MISPRDDGLPTELKQPQSLKGLQKSLIHKNITITADFVRRILQQPDKFCKEILDFLIFITDSVIKPTYYVR